MKLTDEQCEKIMEHLNATMTKDTKCWGWIDVIRATESAATAPLLARIADLEAKLAQAEQDSEPADYQFQARDGKWHGFIDEKHMDNTVADGSWPIRALYTSPPKKPA